MKLILTEDEKKTRLCYVEDGLCFFTSHFDKQWGDSWGVIHYENSAGHPYTESNGETFLIVEVYIPKCLYGGTFDEPKDAHFNSPYSVKTINMGATPWLSDIHGEIFIYAGMTLQEVIDLLSKHNLPVFIGYTEERT